MPVEEKQTLLLLLPLPSSKRRFQALVTREAGFAPRSRNIDTVVAPGLDIEVAEHQSIGTVVAPLKIAR